jgi:hypothetical protein
MNVTFVIIFYPSLIKTIEDELNVAFIIIFFARGQDWKKDKEKKGLMYTYLPQMHRLSFGIACFATLF